MATPELLTSTTAIARHIPISGIYTGTVVEDAIRDEGDNLYYEFGDPLARAVINTDSDYTKYFVGERKIYRIDNIYYGTTTKVVLGGSGDYTVNTTSGIITLVTGSSISSVDSYNDGLYVDYVPGLYSKLIDVRTSKLLLETTDSVSGEDISKELSVVEKKVEEIENRISQLTGIVRTSEWLNYDVDYGVNAKKITQRLKRNTFIV